MHTSALFHDLPIIFSPGCEMQNLMYRIVIFIANQNDHLDSPFSTVVCVCVCVWGGGVFNVYRTRDSLPGKRETAMQSRYSIRISHTEGKQAQTSFRSKRVAPVMSGHNVIRKT